MDSPALVAHVKGLLAGFKAPKHVLAVPSVQRAANGKLDYRRLKAEAEKSLSMTS